MAARLAAAALLLLRLGAAAAAAAANGTTGNVFVDRGPARIEDILFGTDASRHAAPSACAHSLGLGWVSQLGASVYATPVISRLPEESSPRVVAATYARFIEAARGSDGHEPRNYPLDAGASLFHASPLLYDADGDGVDDLVLVAYDGHVSVVDQRTALPMTAINPRVGRHEVLALQVPRLRVKRGWYTGLHDPSTEPAVRVAGTDGLESPDAHLPDSDGPDGPGSDGSDGGGGDDDDDGGEDDARARAALRARRAAAEAASGGGAAASRGAAGSFGENSRAAELPIGPFGGMTVEAARSFELFSTDAEDEGGGGGNGPSTVGPETERRRAARASRARVDATHIYIDPHVLGTPALADTDGDGYAEELVVAVSYYFDASEGGAGGGAEDAVAELERAGEDAHKYVAGGVVAFKLPSARAGGGGGGAEGALGGGDAEGAGRASSAPPPLKYTLPAAPLWSTQLDLTTGDAAERAYIYSPPTVVDLEADGEKEVLVGTSMGFVYVLSARGGATRAGWPVQMAEVQGKVVAHDVLGDASLEVIATDAHGHVAVYSPAATLHWERQLSGLAAHGVAVGDVDGDGAVDLVLATSAGAVHALRAETGEELPGFPVRAGERILAPPLLIQLARTAEAGGGGGGARGGARGGALGGGSRAPRSLPSADEIDFTSDAVGSRRGALDGVIVVPAFDGRLYLIRGRDGCTSSLDLGEQAYAQPLATDLAFDGRVELVVATMHGGLFALETSTPVHPARVPVSGGRSAAVDAAAPPGALAGATVSVHFAGAGGRARAREVVGASFSVTAVVGDGTFARALSGAGGSAGFGARAAAAPRYTLRLFLGGREVGHETAPAPGQVEFRSIGSLPARTRAPLRVRLTDAHGRVAEDEIVLAFNTSFHRALKWMLAAPLLALAAAIAFAPAAPDGDAEATLLGL